MMVSIIDAIHEKKIPNLRQKKRRNSPIRNGIEIETETTQHDTIRALHQFSHSKPIKIHQQNTSDIPTT